MYGIDIKEDELLAMGGSILDTLLIDRTTGENIIWATDDYAALGDAYTFHQHILPELITGKDQDVIQPRVAKKEKERRSRSRKMAEVFTPSWVCNDMNTGVDEKWFKRKPVFNVVSTEGGRHSWTPTTEKVTFPEGKIWQEYVSMGVIEITCGEAPFLASRYDTVTGEAIENLNRRIGWLDRKLRIVNENTTTREDWLYWAKMAIKGTLGYEWQGDNLLLARENLLMSFFDYHEARFGEQPSIEDVKEVAEIISWNIFQMDGLKFVIPRSCHSKILEQQDIMSGVVKRTEIECEGCKKGLIHKHNGIYVKMMDWETGKTIRFDQINGLAKIEKLR
ncbi:MAG: restriction endonuclease subunit M [Bacteroidaceae bacterium]|nr:restriction endonuclease subunit M [Bacteroidaceae bacterium]